MPLHKLSYISVVGKGAVPEGVSRAMNVLDGAWANEPIIVGRFIVVHGVKYAQGENALEIADGHAEFSRLPGTAWTLATCRT